MWRSESFLALVRVASRLCGDGKGKIGSVDSPSLWKVREMVFWFSALSIGPAFRGLAELGGLKFDG
jgi:hypothetical protein